MHAIDATDFILQVPDHSFLPLLLNHPLPHSLTSSPLSPSASRPVRCAGPVDASIIATDFICVPNHRDLPLLRRDDFFLVCAPVDFSHFPFRPFAPIPPHFVVSQPAETGSRRGPHRNGRLGAMVFWRRGAEWFAV